MSLSFFVWRSGCAREVLWPDLPDIELGYPLTHSLQHIFERRGLVLDPSQRIGYAPPRKAIAIALALKTRAQIDTADVSDWLPEKPRTLVPGAATVVFHAIIWQYLNQTTRSKLIETLEDVGSGLLELLPDWP